MIETPLMAFRMAGITLREERKCGSLETAAGELFP
jgi:hypothetical protein